MASLLGFCSVTVLCESNVKLFVAQEYTTIFQALQLLHGKWWPKYLFLIVCFLKYFLF
jgi:hypothetical protein